MKKIALAFLIAMLSSCGTADNADCEKLHNYPGGAYYAGFIVENENCNLADKPNEQIWADVAPQGDNRYNIGFWKFYFERAILDYSGNLNLTHETMAFPYVYETVATGAIQNKKIDLKIAWNVYALDDTDQRTLVCTVNFLLAGKKIIDYPSP